MKRDLKIGDRATITVGKGLGYPWHFTGMIVAINKNTANDDVYFIYDEKTGLPVCTTPKATIEKAPPLVL
jgi:hypothetical protein